MICYKYKKKWPYLAVICSELLLNHKGVDETTPGFERDSLAMFCAKFGTPLFGSKEARPQERTVADSDFSLEVK